MRHTRVDDLIPLPVRPTGKQASRPDLEKSTSYIYVSNSQPADVPTYG